MTCVTLQGGTVLPAAEKNDLHVCSVGNTPEYNKILRKNCAELMTADELDVEGQYKEIMGQWKRWAGAVRRVVNYDEAGIAQIPESAIVPVSPDNPAFPRRFGPPVKEHKIGYVTFYDENLDVKHEKHPLVFVFHGGGDSSLATSLIAEWPEIAKREGFIVVAPEAHMGITATEVIALLEHLKEEYAIDEEKVYSTGFSMGGGKSWDLYEQYPQYFAGIAPMDATGIAVQGARLLDPEKSNQDVLVPMFYIGGCASPLPSFRSTAKPPANASGILRASTSGSRDRRSTSRIRRTGLIRKSVSSVKRWSTSQMRSSPRAIMCCIPLRAQTAMYIHRSWRSQTTSMSCAASRTSAAGIS